MVKFKIRRADAGDEEQIAKVHVRAWQEAYQGIISQQYLDQLPSEIPSRILNWRKSFANPSRWVWVAEVEDRIVGFAVFGLPRDSDREGYIELGAIYLLAEQKNKGIGISLLSTGFGFMNQLGYQKAYCWVLERNPTVQFYKRSGAVFHGQTKNDEIAGEAFIELAYEWESTQLERMT